MNANLLSRLKRGGRLMLRGLLRRGQNRLVIVPEQRAPMTGEPIFIIGCPRSGTSLLRRMVDSHSRIACPPESWFLLPLFSMVDHPKAMRGLEGMGFARDVVLERMRVFAQQFFEDYARAHGKPRWADKTPFYIDCLDRIDELFEHRPRYVMIYRHGLDVAYSMIASLPGWVERMPDYSSVPDDPEPARQAAAYWREQVRKMRAFQERHPGRCFEVRYEELCEAPAAVLADLCAFLGEAFEEAMVHFHRVPHDDGIEDRTVRLTRGIEPSTKTYRNWSRAQIAAALEEAGDLLDELGYAV